MNDAEEYIFTFRNVTAAILAEKTLHDSGVSVRVMPMADGLGGKCGISLRVDPDCRQRAFALLEDCYHRFYALERRGGAAVFTLLREAEQST